MTDYRYDYTIAPNNNSFAFSNACKKIKRYFPTAIEKELLVDVDGSKIQEYVSFGESIVVYDDYDIGAVYIKSQKNLNGIF